MSITNTASGTSIDEVADGIFRISTPVAPPGLPGGFTFNQFLILDEAPLLFHTGPRRIFPLTREAIATVIDPAQLRYIGFSHHEADENGALLEFLDFALEASPVCGKIAAMVSVSDMTDRPVTALADGQTLSLGKHTLRWLDTPHLPHAWECGYLFDETTKTLLCGDLFTQPGTGMAAITEGDILGPSEAMRSAMEYYAHSSNTGALLDKLIALQPTTLAPMHGSAWRGDGAGLLTELKAKLLA
ncbi:MAG: MBL fold metallo-hydrolase [bacterium]